MMTLAGRIKIVHDMRIFLRNDVFYDVAVELIASVTYECASFQWEFPRSAVTHSVLHL